MVSRRTISSIALAGVLAVALPLALRVEADARDEHEPGKPLRLEPPEVRIGMFFDGVTVNIEAMVPAQHDVALLCAGREGTVELKKKGKVGGILWMNVGEVKFERVPSVYVLTTSGLLSGLAPAPLLQEFGLGYEALELRSPSSAEGAEKHELFAELVKLKESEQLFSFNEGAVRLEPTADGKLRVSASCFLPACSPPGEYDVSLFAFKDGQGRLLYREKLRLVRVAASDFISSLAEERGLLYGILAVAIALGAGLLAGFVFGRSSRKRH